MAACSTTSIVVSGAGLTSVNGTYVSAGTETVNGVLFTRFTKDGNINSLPYIGVSNNYNPPGIAAAWVIVNDIGSFFGIQRIYGTDPTATSSLPDCPIGLIFSAINGPWGAYSPAPTVTSAPAPGPDCSIPANRCAFAAGGESGRSRFRRLVALGYV
jgi:hypothetical protein